MVKAVSGYLTKDNRFFTDQTAAELNEAEEALIEVLDQQLFSAGATVMDTGRILSFISTNYKAIQRYIFAWSKKNDLSATREAHVREAVREVISSDNKTTTKSTRSKPPKVVKSDTDNGQTEERVQNV